jgi:UDP-N-acetylglucosamine 1-carboxyvinyltransferase
MSQFIINGGKKLKGEVKISGSKNAALPILAATLLTDKPCVLKNIPDIEDIHTMLTILRSLGSEVEFKNHTVRIQTENIKQENIDHKLGCKMRASVLLLGPLLARTGFAQLPVPGGCVLGARPINTHTEVLAQLGIKKTPSKDEEIIFKGKPTKFEVILPEFSVTATENAIMAAALSKKEVQIRLAAIEPHVQDLCNFLVKLGVSIKGIGTHSLKIKKTKELKSATYSITPDYLEVGTFVVAAILTRGNVTIKNIAKEHLDAFWNLLRKMGVNFKFGPNSVKILPTKNWNACERLQTNVFPGFPTDLQPPFVVLLTQAVGDSYVHEALFEGRFKYFPELNKMGAQFEVKNQHEAIVKGGTPLNGTTIKSWDIRAGAAMILAGLAAVGETVITDIKYIDRGYEKLDEKLRALGADIRRAD